MHKICSPRKKVPYGIRLLVSESALVDYFSSVLGLEIIKKVVSIFIYIRVELLSTQIEHTH